MAVRPALPPRPALCSNRPQPPRQGDEGPTLRRQRRRTGADPAPNIRFPPRTCRHL